MYFLHSFPPCTVYSLCQLDQLSSTDELRENVQYIPRKMLERCEGYFPKLLIKFGHLSGATIQRSMTRVMRIGKTPYNFLSVWVFQADHDMAEIKQYIFLLQNLKFVKHSRLVNLLKLKKRSKSETFPLLIMWFLISFLSSMYISAK